MNWLILSIFAAIVIYYMVSTAYTIASPNVPCENVTFTANYTYYNLANTPTVAVYNIYDDAACTNAYPADRWDQAANYSLRLNANGTTEWPNITVGNHYVNYDYQKSATVFGIDMGFMGFLVIIGVVLVLVSRKLIKA